MSCTCQIGHGAYVVKAGRREWLLVVEPSFLMMSIPTTTTMQAINPEDALASCIGPKYDAGLSTTARHGRVN